MSIVTNPQGAFGNSALGQQLGRVIWEFDTSAAVTGPKVVSLTTEGKVATSATDGTASLCAGVALGTVASGDTAKVVVMGIVEDVPCDGAIAAGNIVKRSVTTAGSVAVTATPAAGEALGVALAASASNLCKLYLFRSL